MRRCTACGETKPLDRFGVERRNRSGYTSRCKTCRNTYARKQYWRSLEANRAKKRVASTKRRARPEVKLAEAERMRQWRLANPEEARRRSRKANARLAANGYFRDWYQQNLERERERQRRGMAKLRAKRPDLERERKQRYRRNNAETVARREREKTYARRAKQPYSPELAQFMADLVTQPCTYCGATANITIDHIVPLPRGGRHEPMNLAPACFSCNSSKGNRLLFEWTRN